jgi:prepilin-type processing-associated H-X9-DG protein
LLVLVALLLPSVQAPRSGSRSPCTNNLKQIGIALLNYLDQRRSFPPANVADEHGRPLHSWRVLILPYAEDVELRNLSKQYRFDEPWNGPNNRKLAEAMPTLFRCPNTKADDNETSYVAVVGPATVWPGDKRVRLHDARDGTSRTIMVVEIADSGINWLEPRDLPFEQAVQGINPPHVKLSISSGHPGGANVAFCDSSVHFLSDDIPPETLRALLTRHGGEEVKIPKQ